MFKLTVRTCEVQNRFIRIGLDSDRLVPKTVGFVSELEQDRVSLS